MNKIKKKIKLKIGDPVQVCVGKDKNKIGKISGFIKKTNKVLIDDLNRKIKHISPKNQTDSTPKKGQKKVINAPIDISNIAFWDEDLEISSRLGTQFKDGKKVRYLKKIKKIIS